MDTIICDISALRFWRTPPVVRLLASGQVEGTSLQKHVTEERLARLQNDLVVSLPICGLFTSGARWRRLGRRARNLRDVFLPLAPCLSAPVDLLVDRPGARRTDLIRPHVWSGELPPGSIVPISDEVYVASPAFALQQVVTRATLVDGLMIASELCGSFAVYDCPAPVKRVVNDLLSSDASKRVFNARGAWRPCLNGGAISSLWSRPQLVEPHELLEFAEMSGSTRGKARLREVAELVKPGAASPLEVQTGMLLGLSRRRGGEGLDGYEYNKRVPLSTRAQALAQKSACVCDLYYASANLDIECQSKLVHDNEESLISDFDRSAALREMGINVLFASSGIVASPRRFDAFADLVANELGINRPKQTDAHRSASVKLRARLDCDWRRLI